MADVQTCDFGDDEGDCFHWSDNWESDYGQMALTVNGFSVTVNYNSSSDPTSLASAIVAALNVSSSPVTPTSSGGNIYLTSKATGSSVNYSLSYSCYTSDPKDFVTGFSISGPASMSGGQDASW